MTPVITHPERNGLLRQRLPLIERWVEEGALVQVTALSLTGKFGKSAAQFSQVLLEKALVHVIASDAHDCEHRPPRMDLAYTWLTGRYGESLARALCVDNPSAVLQGRPVERTQTPSNKGRNLWTFWKR